MYDQFFLFLNGFISFLLKIISFHIYNATYTHTCSIYRQTPFVTRSVCLVITHINFYQTFHTKSMLLFTTYQSITLWNVRAHTHTHTHTHTPSTNHNFPKRESPSPSSTPQTASYSLQQHQPNQPVKSMITSHMQINSFHPLNCSTSTNNTDLLVLVMHITIITTPKPDIPT